MRGRCRAFAGGVAWCRNMWVKGTNSGAWSTASLRSHGMHLGSQGALGICIGLYLTLTLDQSHVERANLDRPIAAGI